MAPFEIPSYQLVQAIERGVCALAVLASIKAFSFFLGGHAQAALKQNLHHKADDDRHYSNEHDGDKDALDLSDEQRGITGVQQAAEVGP